MIIIVDAYNLLRAIPPYKKTITDQERVAFIARLSSYAREKDHKVVIVFDGGPFEWPAKESRKRIEIVYSGTRQTADDYIKQYIQNHHSKDLLLVSSDRELNHYAQLLNIPSIDSSSFYDLLREYWLGNAYGTNNMNEGIVVKMVQDSQQDIDDIMLEASKTISSKSEDFVVGRRGNKIKNKSDKIERMLLKKLKKL